jgi:hypothetical protein
VNSRYWTLAKRPPPSWPDEGQINRLNMLKRAMYGRAGVPLLRVRMCPLHQIEDHQI